MNQPKPSNNSSGNWELLDRPIGQVTVFDGAHGDCNLIDLCQFPPEEKNRTHKTPLWRRILIDTGAKKEVLAKTVATAIRTHPVPAVTKTDASRHEVPPLREMQITHFDDDHIGNAGYIMKQLKDHMQHERTKDCAYECELVMNILPPPWPTFRVRFMGATRLSDPEKNDQIFLKFNIEGLSEWEKTLADLHFAVGIDIYQDKERCLILQDQKDTVEAKVTLRKIVRELQKILKKVQNESLCLEFLLEVIWTVGMPGIVDGMIGDGMKRHESVSFPVEFNYELLAPLVIHTLKVGNYLEKEKNLYKKYGKIRVQGPLEQPVNQNPKVHYKNSINNLMVAIREVNVSRENDPNLVREVKPEIGQRTGMKSLIQQTVSPLPCIRNELIRSMLSNTYNIQNQIDFEKNLENRASVVTIFARKDLISNYNNGPVSMLFTGDAFDQPCDIQRSIASWNVGTGTGDEPKYFNVIKIPHHGSNETVNSDFYRIFRAEVYIICGSHHMHGNPKFSTLKAIVSGFQGNQRGSRLPFRLYFSDPRIDEDSRGEKERPSPIKKIMLDSDLKPDEERRNYEAYKLEPRPDQDKSVSWGSILFSMDETGNMMDKPGHGWEYISLHSFVKD
ncbi:uncharacterized protein TRUGW13939_11233 [Talaromyces rugulosus]|uniref:Metallo-beta-lactamase domain-containing protein n=1 Tax=Talaromyces rugulosus TaxID=121627 RepID=A0A7H8RC70_TALRU|nr:uncharacterized protein TRUGW13939_11233 [Talaromyces rugulosus]QKX64060.1 hypothetical protein TRUGW13939_11233 [Talaromyces rugulosus]